MPSHSLLGNLYNCLDNIGWLLAILIQHSDNILSYRNSAVNLAIPAFLMEIVHVTLFSEMLRV